MKENLIDINTISPFIFGDPSQNLLNKGVKMLSAHEEGLARPVTFEDLLVSVGARHDRDAFVRIFEHYAPRVKSFLMKGGMSADEADDLAQETLLTVWHKAPSYDPRRAGAATWIYTIARNKKIDALRRKTPLTGLAADRGDDDIPDPASSNEGIFEDAFDARTVSRALKTLPPEQADLIRRSFFEDKTHSDIAAETGIPLGTVKSRIRLALERLRRDMGEVRP